MTSCHNYNYKQYTIHNIFHILPATMPISNVLPSLIPGSVARDTLSTNVAVLLVVGTVSGPAMDMFATETEV